MKISVRREGGTGLLELVGRLDREWSEHLSRTLERLLQDGVRSLRVDLSGVTYLSSAGTHVLTRWQKEVASLRGEVQLLAPPPVVQEAFALVGWDVNAGAPTGSDERGHEFRRSSWHAWADFAASGQYEYSALAPAGQLSCRLHGDPTRLLQAPYGPDDCTSLALPDGTFGLGLGAIGKDYVACRERLGELVGVGGSVAYFPSDGARKPDYLVGGTEQGSAPGAVLASGLSCSGEFSQLIRFSPRPEAQAVPVAEIAAIGLDAVGSDTAGIVIAGETAGLSGARLRRSPGNGHGPLSYAVPAVRDWLLFAPERTHVMSTAVIVGVVTRKPTGPLAAQLRPLSGLSRAWGHFHAAIFSYYPVPQRTVELGTLVRGLFTSQRLRDVLHLVWDDRETGVKESELLRGVAWAGPIPEIK